MSDTPEHVRKYREAYIGLFSKMNETIYMPIFPKHVPEPDEDMVKRGAIWLGRGVDRRNFTPFLGWATSDKTTWTDSVLHWNGDGPHLYYALDPSDPNADKVLAFFRPDLVSSEPPARAGGPIHKAFREMLEKDGRVKSGYELFKAGYKAGVIAEAEAEKLYNRLSEAESGPLSQIIEDGFEIVIRKRE